MEDLHHIHKGVPFGYWIEWVVPAWRAITRKWGERRAERLAAGLDQLSAPH